MVEQHVRRRPIIHWPLDRWRYYLAAFLTALLAFWALWALWPPAGSTPGMDTTSSALATAVQTAVGTSVPQPSIPAGTGICVEGTLRNVQDRAPLGSWQIRAIPLDSSDRPLPERAILISSSNDGSFRFPSELEAGSWRFSLEDKEGWRSAGGQPSVDIELQESESCFPIDFRIQKVVDLQIDVVDQNNNPLADWSIRLEPAPNTPQRETQEMRTDAEGRVIISLPLGGWLLTQAAPNNVAFIPLLPRSDSVKLILVNDAAIRLRNRLDNGAPPSSTTIGMETPVVSVTQTPSGTVEAGVSPSPTGASPEVPNPTATPVPIIGPPSTCLPDNIDSFVPPHYIPPQPCPLPQPPMKHPPIQHPKYSGPHGGHHSGGHHGGGHHGRCRYQHRVHKGEWIYKIARHYGVAPHAIVYANPWLRSHPDRLMPGTYLCIP